MTPLECAKLLTLVSTIDNRTVAPETVNMWHPIVGHIDFDIAVEAVQLHFKESEAYLLPAHVVACSRRVKETRARMVRRSQRQLERAQITLDREQFDRETAAAIEARRSHVPN